MSKTKSAATTMWQLLQESEDAFTLKNDDPNFDCRIHSKMFGVITIKDSVINFVSWGPGFEFNTNNEFDVTCLNDFVAENS